MKPNISLKQTPHSDEIVESNFSVTTVGFQNNFLINSYFFVFYHCLGLRKWRRKWFALVSFAAVVWARHATGKRGCGLPTVLIGSLSNDDGDGNENATKQWV